MIYLLTSAKILKACRIFFVDNRSLFISIITNLSDSLMIVLPPAEESTKHNPFTTEELEMLWKHSDDKRIRTVLILCYTGIRPTEFLKIRHENVFLDKRYLMGGIKTEAGKNRAIPIAKKILPFVTELYNNNNEYLIQDEDGPLNYDHFRSRYWEPAMTRVKMSHLPHDGRHTCATLMDNADINDKIKKLILGHSSRDVTQKVYTHKTLEQLIEAIDKI